MLKQAHTQKVTYQQWQKGDGIDENGKKYDLVIINKEKEVLTNSKLLSTVTEMIVNENKQYSAFKLKKKQKNILRPQCNTTKAKPCSSNRDIKEEQNNY